MSSKRASFSLPAALVLGLTGAAFVGCIGEEPVLPTSFTECEEPYVLCGNSCVDTRDDPLHCGDCETVCSEDEACHDGVCGCGFGALDCGDACVNYLGDPFHCGNCDTVCDTEAGEVCSLGECTFQCRGGTELCGDACVNTTYDAGHCGKCDTACGAGELCTNGKCALACAGGTTRCGKSCIDTDTDPAHCGDCATVCDTEAGEVCSDGECTLSCGSGTTRCDDVCIDLDVDAAHCGDCDTRCDELAACVAGKCACPTGYDGNGESCSDTDECAGENECSPNADCLNVEGSYACRCHDDQSGDGETCTGYALVTVSLTGQAGDGDALSVRLSEDGRYAAFVSLARNLVPTYSYYMPQAFRRDLRARFTEYVSLSDDDDVAGREIEYPLGISADGNIIAFQTIAAGLAGNADEADLDVFTRNVEKGETLVHSESAEGQPEKGFGYAPALAPDGRYVAFASSRHLVPQTGNLLVNIYRVEIGTEDWELIDVNDQGEAAFTDEDCGGAGTSYGPSLSRDGKLVAFETTGVGLVSGLNGNCQLQVYLRDLRDPDEPKTTLVSATPNGDPCTSASGEVGTAAIRLSADGRWAVFYSGCNDLVGTDAHDYSDIFVRDLVNEKTIKVSVDLAGGESDGHSWNPQISGDGRYVAFTSEATDLISGDTNGLSDLFLRDLKEKTTTRINVQPNGAQLASATHNFGLAGNGAAIAFMTNDKLLPEDTNDWADVYLRYLW